MTHAYYCYELFSIAIADSIACYTTIDCSVVTIVQNRHHFKTFTAPKHQIKPSLKVNIICEWTIRLAAYGANIFFVSNAF